jgi:microsomal dipeptidase-like Zn-dependent dipeptidase
MKKKSKILIYFIVSVLLIYFLVISFVPKIIDKQHNQIRVKAPYNVSEKSRELYDDLSFIADMHCDALLWRRDLLKDNDFGQVDIPKMIKANIGLQAFTIVTKSPKNQNYDNNTGDTDNITSLYLVQGRPTSSLTKRAILQCRELYGFAEKSKGKFRIITTSKELTNFISDREKNGKLTAGFLGVEGAHALDGKIENVQVLYDNGVRMMSAVHFFDNKLGSSAHGIKKEGLTEFGKSVILKMESLDMIIDIAHCASMTIDDIIEIANGPIISSHTGVRGTCDNSRNLSDKHLKAIADSGGLISIAMFEEAVCGVDAAATAKAMKYTAELVGVDFVSLGSDFDGSVMTPFDITGLPLIVEELQRTGFNEDDIKKVMGENVKNFMLKNLP